MTTILAILVLAVLFALFGLFMRGRQRACGSGGSCEALGQDGVCSANADPTSCPLAPRGPRTGGEQASRATPSRTIEGRHSR
ncbi:MAG: hypothetical protein A2W08_15725 [Candidatus Rokubacteria bacterium RBG_16_73_20]|nr:MAG: hypothetical protein A2050_05095 [Candidatus Rokubacteria bacterium GWA2_73_35]OGK95431.1 MAG: hypothetical protein A2W08_15725 [Candidatus Rokubacteria bacterium RBG_16_73_20]HBH04098.1 hypothetical protein [Candidatus Rokubacteria bacterium]